MKNNHDEKRTNKNIDDKETQKQTDPQLTELRGFIDPNEKLEPTAGSKQNKKDSHNKNVRQ